MSLPSPWLSVLVPAYNVGAYLEECLESIGRQLLPGVEIVVLNDASTDDCGAILTRAQDAFGGALRVVTHAQNAGIATVRNRLLREGRGRWFWFVDGDDMLVPGALDALHAIIERDAPDLVLCDFRMLRADFRLKHRLRGENHRRTFQGRSGTLETGYCALVAGIMLRGQLHCWSKIAKREVWQAVVFPDGHYFEEFATVPQLMAAVRSYCYVAKPWIAYRQRAGSILAGFSPVKVRDLALGMRELHAALNAGPEPLDRDARFALEQFCLKTHASMARHLTSGKVADEDGLSDSLRASLNAIFPTGTGTLFREYLRRGWLLRARRAHASLKRAGFA